jgi:hypothetical protein
LQGIIKKGDEMPARRSRVRAISSSISVERPDAILAIELSQKRKGVFRIPLRFSCSGQRHCAANKLAPGDNLPVHFTSRHDALGRIS